MPASGGYRPACRRFRPRRQAPTCQCGEPLVGVAWRGRATIRCRVCGSRWGVDVIDDKTESCWSIDGPSPAWLQAHPVDDHDPYGDFQPEDVLRDGVPALPTAGIEPGVYFPVAVWQSDRDAAVLYVHRRESGESDRAGDEYEDETQHLVRADDGAWVTAGSGGGTWVNVFDPPVELLEKYMVLGTGISGSGEGEDAISFTEGLCSRAVASVETVDDHETRA